MPTQKAHTTSVAYVNADDWLDVLFTSHNTGDAHALIYWGADDGLDADTVLRLPTYGGNGNSIADYDADGVVDVFLANYGTDGNPTNSYLYSGSPQGPDPAQHQDLLTHNAHYGIVRDSGNVYDRLDRYLYESAPRDAGGPVAPGLLSWTAEVPAHTSLSFQLRSALTPEALDEAVWQGPDGAGATWYEQSGTPVASIHLGHRYWQYRVLFARERPVPGPVLSRVELSTS